MKRKFLTLLCVAGLSLWGSTALAADVGGEVQGTVKSSSGEAVSGATVTVKHSEKGITRSTTSGAGGAYRFRSLPVGEYTLSVSSDGYSTAESTINVLVGTPLVVENTLQAGSLEEVVVVGTVIKKLNMSETTGGMSFDDAQMDLMPVDNGFEAMVLMTPGTVQNGAPDDFRGASSVGGASSAENGYYLNGINVTQIQSGLGSLPLAWEAIEQTDVQTSGIGAEFGGALGGIVNSVSKSGTNEFEFGIQYRIDPESTYDHQPSVRSSAGTPPANFILNNEKDETEFTEWNIWASGPIVEDKAFFYVLLNPRTENYQYAGNSTGIQEERDSDRWFVNLDWYLTDQHSIGFTSFNTKRDITYDNFSYDPATNEFTGSNPQSFDSDGGDFNGINYHGELTDKLTLDVIWGSIHEEETPVPGNNFPRVDDCRTGTCFAYSNYTNTTIVPREFTRDQFRFDFNLDLGAHQLAFGYDSYEIDVFENSTYNGATTIAPADTVTDNSSDAIGYWQFGTSCTDSDVCGEDGVFANAAGVPAGENFIERRVRNRISDSTVSSKAFYVQDSWAVNDVLTLNLGVRITDFENTVSSGEAYADLTGNVAPRLAAIWDIGGEGKRKFFASFGRYFQPVAARMNITQGSSSIEYFDWYQVSQVDSQGRPALGADGAPIRGDRFPTAPRDYRQVGITDPNLIASQNLEAMYSDQISFGYSTEVSDTLTASVRATYNELKRSVEDTDYGPVIARELADLGIANNTGQSSFYVLANPGEEVIISYDFDNADGDRVNADGYVTVEGGRTGAETLVLTPAELDLDAPVRKYIAWDFTLGGQPTDRFAFDASYTWSHSYGNTEGLVKTTNGQADPGWTSDYDYGDALDHAMGNLPNDRRHQLKFSGTYDINDQFTLGMVARVATGRPLNSLRDHPLDADRCLSGPWAYDPGPDGVYGNDDDTDGCISRYYIGGFYDADGNPAPRGSAGTLPTTTNIDMSIAYKNDEILGGLLLKATVYNLLAADNPIDVDEWLGPDYNTTERYQDARFLSLIARLEF